jgi:hypothetical protein
MNQTTTLLRLASRCTMLGILICSINTPLWSGDLPQGKCKKVCQVVGYTPKVIINLLAVGQNVYASPACACVKPGGTVIWQNEDPDVPWTVVFQNPNPIDTPGNISDFDDTWFMLSNATLQEYHYTATLGGVSVDPHVVVGDHPPLEIAKQKQKKGQ